MKEIKKELFSYSIPILIMILFESFFVGYNCGLYMPVVSTKILILSCIFIYIFYLILLGISKSTYKSSLTLSIILYIFSIINQLKIIYTDEPIVFSDILYLRSAGEIVSIVDGTIFNMIKHYIIPAIIYMIITIVICIISYKNNIIIENKKERKLFIIIPFSILILLFVPCKFTTNFMLNNVFDIQERVDYASSTSNIIYFCKYGVISGMYGQLLENRIFEPNDYDENKLNEILEEKDDTNSDNSFGTPNIIVLFGESFWDIDQLEELKFNTKVTSNLEKLKNEGIFFNMISPSYGGVSANVEFEFLTGANLMYFNKGYVPYMQLYNNKSYYYKPSIISELKNNGYNTKIVTYTSKGLFDCGRFYKYIGVDETEFNEDIDDENIKGKYVSDEYVVDKIINEFENKNKNEKLFYMTLTMQAHMPYLIDKYENYDVDIVSSNLEQSMNETVISYAQGIYDTDKQLGRLYEYIQTLDEPTLLVFYGDHLPYLETSEGVNILDYLQYFNTDDELLNYYRMYNTQALVLANFEINDDENEYLGPDLLGTYILNRMDINISNYYKWLYNYKDNLAASNHIVSIDSKGQLYYTNNLSIELKEVYNIRKNMQYKFFIK